MDSLLMKLAGKGYGWYLALKVCKAICFPFFVIGWTAYAVFGFAFVWTGGCIVSAYETWQIVASDFRIHVLNPRWFSGFGRAYYQGLRHYMSAPTWETKEGDDG